MPNAELDKNRIKIVKHVKLFKIRDISCEDAKNSMCIEIL